MEKIQSVAVLTSGGDSPGMNACIRAVTRTAIFNGMKVFGVYRGYEGLVNGELKEFTTEMVSNTIQRGGTILKTARCQSFMTPEGRQKAYENLQKFNIQTLIVIGGNGSLSGAYQLAREYDMPVIGIPGTIDNDITATDNTIGFDTAMQTVVENVDRLRDTCESHARCNVVEVMGRGAGDIALNTAIACGAVAAAIPEVDFDEDACIERIVRLRRGGKRNFIVIVSEGVSGHSEELAKKINDYTKDLAEKENNDRLWVETKFCRLAHTVRGGSPTLGDRLLATRMGVRAVDELLAGNSDLVICEKAGKIVTVPIAYSQVLDRMYKGTLKDGMLDKYSKEEIEQMKLLIEEKKNDFRTTYAMMEQISG